MSFWFRVKFIEGFKHTKPQDSVQWCAAWATGRLKSMPELCRYGNKWTSVTPTPKLGPHDCVSHRLGSTATRSVEK